MTLEELEEFYKKYGIEKSNENRKNYKGIWENPPVPEGKRLVFTCY